MRSWHPDDGGKTQKEPEMNVENEPEKGKEKREKAHPIKEEKKSHSNRKK